MESEQPGAKSTDMTTPNDFFSGVNSTRPKIHFGAKETAPKLTEAVPVESEQPRAEINTINSQAYTGGLFQSLQKKSAGISPHSTDLLILQRNQLLGRISQVFFDLAFFYDRYDVSGIFE